MLWDVDRAEAIKKGNLIHHALSMIVFKEDIEQAIKSIKSNGDITSLEMVSLGEKIKQIVFHPQLDAYFNNGLEVYNEKDILTPEGLLLRPDRLVIENNVVTIIDYKTGAKSENHKNQLLEYAHELKRMKYIIKNKILVYINKTVEPVFI